MLGMVPTERTMSLQITTDADVMRQTMQRIAVSTGISLAMTATFTLMSLGGNPDALVRVGDVIIISLCAATMIAAVISGILSYRSARLMKELTLTRRELSRLSQTDKLTGLLNRRGFDEAATLALRTACQASASAVVFMCDIDHFKSVNDRFGHEFGDKALQEIAAVLREFAASRGGLVARHGGEEFAALMTGISREQAEIFAEEIRCACAHREIRSGDVCETMTISIGFTVTRGETDLARIMRIADQALYMAKRQGRDRVIRADDAPPLAAA
jgi:diguanylate cyclase (GGDEF)-like protein